MGEGEKVGVNTKPYTTQLFFLYSKSLRLSHLEKADVSSVNSLRK